MRRAILVLAFFVLLSAITLSPLSYHLGSMAPAAYKGEYDYYHFHWNLWWVRHAVLNGQNPFYTDMVLAPFTNNLSYHSLTPVLLPEYLLLEPIFGHLRAANLIMWISLTLTGVLMTVFLRRMRISYPVALLGGVLLAFSPYMLDHIASGHLNLITVFWIPLVLIIWERVEVKRRIGWAVLLGIVLWAMWFTDTLIIFWGLLLLAPCALWAFFQASDRRVRLRLILLGLLALVFTFSLAWFLGPLQPTLDFTSDQLPPARLLTLRYYSIPLRALLLPEPGRTQRLGFERDETLGLVLVLLVLVGLLVRTRDRQRWFWLVAAILPLVLVMGPDINLFGTRIPLPFRLIHEAFHGQMRTPIRFLPSAVVPLIVFAARTYDPWLRRVHNVSLRYAMAAGVLGLLIVELGIFRPYPATPELPGYQFYTMMRQEHYDDYDYVVLEVPSGPYTGWRRIGSHPEAMYYGITHEKRMVSGLLSRIRIDDHLYYETSPLMGWLTQERPLVMDRAIGELTRIVDEWPVGYVVVHLDWIDNEAFLQEVLDIFNGHPSLCFLEVERDAILYRTTSHPKGCPPRLPPEIEPGLYRIPLGEPGDEGFIGHGWYRHEAFGGAAARWAGGQNEALLYASLPTGSDYTMTVRGVAFEEPRTIKVVANAVRLGFFSVQPGDWQEYSLTIPADLIDQVGGNLILSLSADGLISAVDVGLSADTRPLSLAYDWVQFQAGAP
jgi:hypothetical protein